MKKFITIFSFCFTLILIQEVFAQEYIQKGHYMIGGGIHVTISGDANADYFDSYERKYLRLTPYAGKFIKDNLLAGIQLDYFNGDHERTFENSTYSYSYELKSLEYGISLFLKRYILINDKFGGFLKPTIGYSYSEIEDNYSNNNNNYSNEGSNINEVNAGADAGLYYFIGKRFSLETTLASLTLERQGIKNYVDNDDPLQEEKKYNNTNIYLSFINNFSLNRIITINYYF